MSKVEKRTITLSPEQSEYVDSLVSSGEFDSVEEVIQAGFEALQEHDETIERWLREEVVPTIQESIAHPERLLTVEQVRASLHEWHETWMKTHGK